MNYKKLEKPLPVLLLFITGFCGVFFTACAVREIWARFGGSLGAVGVLFFFLLLWLAAGILVVRRGADFSIAAGLVATALLPVTAFNGIFLLLMFPVLRGSELPLPLELTTAAAAGTALFGLNCGVAYGLLGGTEFYRKGGFDYAAVILGAIAAGVYVPFSLSALMPVRLLIIITIGLALTGIFLKFKTRVRLAFAFLLLLALAWGAFSIFYMPNVNRIYWSKLKPDSRCLMTFDNFDGRYALLVKNRRQEGEFQVYKNSSLLWRLPEDCGKYSAIALFSVLQSQNNAQKVLVIGSPFSRVPGLLLGIPGVESVELLCQSRRLAALASFHAVLPPLSKRFKISFDNPAAFFQRWLSDRIAPVKYNLIIILDSGHEKFLNHRIFDAASRYLAPNGVVTVAIAGTDVNSAEVERELKTVFPRVEKMNGKPLLIAAGGDSVTSSAQELERRFEAGNDVPLGTLGVLYSLMSTENETTDKNLPGNGVLPVLPLHLDFLAVALVIAVYLGIRFWQTRKNNNDALFAAFENGFYSMGMLIAAAFIFQEENGGIYQNNSVLIACMLGGIVIGIMFLARSRTMLWLSGIISLLLPLTIPVASGILDWAPVQFLVLALLTLTGIAVGITHANLRAKLTMVSHTLLPSIEFTGAAVITGFAVLYRDYQLGLLFLIGALILVRVLCMMSSIGVRK